MRTWVYRRPSDFVKRLNKLPALIITAGLIIPSGIPSGEAFGSAKLNQQILPSTISSTESFGTTKINQQLKPTAIVSTEAFGTSKIFTDKISPPSIASQENFG